MPKIFNEIKKNFSFQQHRNALGLMLQNSFLNWICKYNLLWTLIYKIRIKMNIILAKPRFKTVYCNPKRFRLAVFLGFSTIILKVPLNHFLLLCFLWLENNAIKHNFSSCRRIIWAWKKRIGQNVSFFHNVYLLKARQKFVNSPPTLEWVSKTTLLSNDSLNCFLPTYQVYTWTAICYWFHPIYSS